MRWPSTRASAPGTYPCSKACKPLGPEAGWLPNSRPPTCHESAAWLVNPIQVGFHLTNRTRTPANPLHAGRKMHLSQTASLCPPCLMWAYPIDATGFTAAEQLQQAWNPNIPEYPLHEHKAGRIGCRCYINNPNDWLGAGEFRVHDYPLSRFEARRSTHGTAPLFLLGG